MVDGRQAEREKLQREAARGARARSALRGDLGPVLKRWASGAVLPTSAKVREFAGHYLGGRLEQAGGCISSPVFGLSASAVPERGRELRTILQWGLQGDRMEDLCLAVVGTAMVTVVKRDKRNGSAVGHHLTPIVDRCGEAARETALGQFITEVQGTKAMEGARTGKEHTWQERSRMESIAALLAGQARSALGDDIGVHVGGREVVSIVNQAGDPRMLTLKRPSLEDWELLDLARRTKGEADVHRPVWLSFAMLVLCASQNAAGMWALVDLPSRGKGKLRGLALSADAEEAIGGDLEKWLAMGFVAEPMVVPPASGDYLTVKHRPVAGAPGPKGIKTDARGTAAWDAAAECMAGTAWTIARDTLAFARTEAGRPYVDKSEPLAGHREMVLGQAGRLALEEAIYLPIYMDFRGRVYYRPSLITVQGNDLQKSLMVFPSDGTELDADGEEALISHAAGLYGGPQKLDKAPFSEREAWWYEMQGKPLEEVLEVADEPLQLYTVMSMVRNREANRVACQIDGTCNGLQHLSALFRDETAAPHVNLCASTREDRPADIYARVADGVHRRLLLVGGDPWAGRILATVKIDRKLCKKPVMVLPYGGTRGTIEDAAHEAVLEQQPYAEHQGVRLCPWRECLRPDGAGGWTRDADAVAGDYLAFRERDLDSHPLLRLDCQRLGGIIWDVINEMLPRPMAAMRAFRSIARCVGARTLEWTPGGDTVSSAGTDERLWIVQAKSVAATSGLSFKGLHLPETVRGLKVRLGRDEVDKKAHMTGIVANFIHSQDADHLARTMRRFCTSTPSFGAIHDCLLTRPSLMTRLGSNVRSAFYSKYGTSQGHPLHQPVRLRDLKTGSLDEYPSWYALAEACKVEFPVLGTWDPEEVNHSAWFFS